VGRDLLGVDVQDAARSAKPLVPAAKVHGADSILPQHAGTHDARLDCDIEISFLEFADWSFGKDSCQGDEFGMSSTVQSTIRLIHATANDLAILDKDTAHGCLVTLERQFGLVG
jgi:hypothetical protein